MMYPRHSEIEGLVGTAPACGMDAWRPAERSDFEARIVGESQHACPLCGCHSLELCVLSERLARLLWLWQVEACRRDAFDAVRREQLVQLPDLPFVVARDYELDAVAKRSRLKQRLASARRRAPRCASGRSP